MTDAEREEVNRMIHARLLEFLGFFELLARSEQQHNGKTLPDKIAVLREGYAKTYREYYGEDPPDTYGKYSGRSDEWPDLLL